MSMYFIHFLIISLSDVEFIISSSSSRSISIVFKQFLSCLVNNWWVPGEEDASLVGWGKESALH